MKKFFFIIAVLFCTVAAVDAQVLKDKNGAKIGAIKSNGTVENKNGAKIGKFDGDKIYDANGCSKGKVSDGKVKNANGQTVGQYEGIRRNDYVACYFFFGFF